jgi:hypothetical protein
VKNEEKMRRKKRVNVSVDCKEEASRDAVCSVLSRIWCICAAPLRAADIKSRSLCNPWMLKRQLDSIQHEQNEHHSFRNLEANVGCIIFSGLARP